MFKPLSNTFRVCSVKFYSFKSRRVSVNIYDLNEMLEREVLPRGREEVFHRMDEVPYLPPKITWRGRILNLGVQVASHLWNVVSNLLFQKDEREIGIGNRALSQAVQKIDSVISPFFTFNCVSYFKVEEGRILHKRISLEGHWEVIPHPQMGDASIACIKADGANLVVFDSRGVVHYKKVVKEKRDGELGPYRFSVKALKDNWKKDWFTLPYLSTLLKVVCGGSLRLDPNDSIAISHRGELSALSLNPLSGKYVRLPNATTLVQYDSRQRVLRLHDPWIPRWTDVTIPLPQSTTYDFEFIAMDVSASLLAVLGYKRTPVKDGHVLKTLTIFTIFADLDSMGLNPLVRYIRGKGSPQDRAWHVALEGWREESLPEHIEGIFPSIRVVQNGPYSTSRTLMLEGLDRWKNSGIFLKMLGEDRWKFCAADISPRQSLGPTVRSWDEGKLSLMNDYQGESDKVVCRITDYSKEAMFIKLYLGDEAPIQIVRLPSYLSYIGMKKSSYAAYCLENAGGPLYREIFGANLIVPVSLNLVAEDLLRLQIGHRTVMCRKMHAGKE